jgi:hypothetical protein
MKISVWFHYSFQFLILSFLFFELKNQHIQIINKNINEN